MIYLTLFWIYLKIGLLGFGGGYAMISLIQYEVVEHYAWVSSEEFADIIAISQMTPGPIGINSATYIGYTATGNVWGALIATFAVMLPSFVLLTLVGRLLIKHKENAYLKGIFVGLRPVMVGLVAAAALLLMTKETFIDYKAILIATAAFVLVYFVRMHPIWVIVLSGVAGFLLY